MENTKLKEVKNAAKYMANLIEENERYNNLKARYMEHAKKVLALAETVKDLEGMLKALAKELDPLVGRTIRKARGKTEDTKPMLNDMFKNLNKGMSLTIEKIMVFYPTLGYQRSRFMFKQLQKMKGVILRKKGRVMFLTVSK